MAINKHTSMLLNEASNPTPAATASSDGSDSLFATPMNSPAVSILQRKKHASYMGKDAINKRQSYKTAVETAPEVSFKRQTKFANETGSAASSDESDSLLYWWAATHPVESPPPVKMSISLTVDPVDTKYDTEEERLANEFRRKFQELCMEDNVDELKDYILQNNQINTVTFHRYTCLEWALLHYSLSVVKCLLEQCGADPSGGETDGNLLLCLRGTDRQGVAKAKYLSSRGIGDCSKANQFGNTPLHLAASCDALELVRVFIDDYHADVNQTNTKGQNALTIALCQGAIRSASCLVDSGAVVDNFFTVDGGSEDGDMSYAGTYSALVRLAIRLGHERQLDALLKPLNTYAPTAEAGIVNATDDDGNTCLHIAAEFGITRKGKRLSDSISSHQATSIVYSTIRRQSTSAHMTSLLLKHGADVMIANATGETAMHVAARVNNVSVAQVLLRQDTALRQLTARDMNGFTALQSAVRHNSLQIVWQLLVEGYRGLCDATALDNRRRSILHLAVEYCSGTSMIDFIVNYLKDSKLALAISRPDIDNNTPLDVATSRGDEKAIRTLLRLTNVMDAANELSFLKAVEADKLQICDIIISVTKGRCLQTTDDTGNTPLHLAASHGHMDIVKLLTSYQANKECFNNWKLSPLHLAARNGHMDIVRFLLDDQINYQPQQDIAGMTPLHHAALNDHLDIVNFFLQKNFDVTTRDVIGRNVLDVAIDGGHYRVCCAILECDSQWRKALMNDINNRELKALLQCQVDLLNVNVDSIVDIFSRKYHDVRETPLRRMIEKMPQLAKVVFDKCTVPKRKGNCNYNFEFLDDSYANWSYKTIEQIQSEQASLYDSSGRIRNTVKQYGPDSVYGKANHPLNLMVKHKREELLYHPLVAALINHKCKLPQSLYVAFLLAYLCLVSLTTTFVLVSTWAHNISLQACDPTTPYGRLHSGDIEHIRYCVWCLLAFGMCVELVQVSTYKAKYLLQTANYLDWVCYLSTLSITIDLTSCGLLQPWQWQLSAFCILLSWINIIMLLRRIPIFGIYVIMVEKVTRSFMMFFVILLLFIMAFAFAFCVLLQNQNVFSTPVEAMIKTAVMMTGEEDFNEIFYNDALTDVVYYRSSTLIIYVLFVATMTIIVLNLLIGLAVGNINDLLDNARLERLALTIDLALDVEQHLPDYVRRKLIVKELTVMSANKQAQAGNEYTRVFSRIIRAIFSGAEADAAVTNNTAETRCAEMKEQMSQALFESKRFRTETTKELKMLSLAIQRRFESFEQRLIKIEDSVRDKGSKMNQSNDSIFNQ